jgi:hypothetical protein
VHRAFVDEQSFLGGSTEWRAVRVGRAEVGVPGIEMGIEVDQSHLAAVMMGRPQQWKRDGVIPADADQPPRPPEQVLGCCLDLADRLLNIEWVAGDITCIGYLLYEERFHVVRRVIVCAKVPGRLPNRDRSEAGARPVAGAGIERDA